MMRHRAADLARRSRARARRAARWSSALPWREVQPHDVDAGARSCARGPRDRSRPGRAWRRSWCCAGIPCSVLRPTEPGRAVIRSPRLSTAGAPRAASCPRGTRGRRRRRWRCSRCGRSMPYLAIAASVSPPPAMRERLRGGDRLARPRAVPRGERVELEHADRSVPDDGAGRAQELARSARRSRGPMSRIRSSSATSSAGLDRRRRVGRERLAADHVAPGSAPPRRAPASSPGSRAPRPARSGSASDLPIGSPAASRKVLAMPPPTMSWSTLAAPAPRGSVSLVETLEPATIATSGRAGCASALPSASSSAASSGPAQATGANVAMPWVVASARCAVPKASFT